MRAARIVQRYALHHVMPTHLPDVGRRVGVALVATLLLTACGATGSATPTPAPTGAAAPTSPAAATASPAPTPSKGPATAQMALVGTGGLTGPVTTQQLVCDEPSLSGPQIFFLGQAGTTAVVLFIQAGHVEVRVATGSAATLRLRSFTGTGVTGFDAASGAQIDTPLTETTAAGSAIGNLGALTSITASIDCGDEQPGTADLQVSGSSKLGPLAGSLSNAHVTCTVQGSDTYVTTTGLTTAGSTPVLLFVNAHTDSLQVIVETGSTAMVYNATGAGLVSLVGNGAHEAGDLPEAVTAGATPSPNVLHVVGDVTCGTTT